MNLEMQPVERRLRTRSRVALNAFVKVQGFDGIPCTVENVSPNGALIVFRRPTIVPNSFTLVIPDSWFQADCDVRHRSADRAGVLFTSSRLEALARFS